MNLFMDQIITPPASLPITVSDAQTDLAAAVVEEIERVHLWRGIVHQRRRIVVDGPLPSRIEIEPVSGILVSITRYTQADAAEVIPASTYNFVTRDPAGAIIIPAEGMNWPAPERSIGSFSINYDCGWRVTPETAPLADDAVNEVPASIRLMIQKAIEFRAGSGVGDLTIGSLTIGLADSYKTDRLPASLISIGNAWAYRPGLFVGRP